VQKEFELASEYTSHIPVLTEKLIELLNPLEGQIAIDCTIGTGGHSKALLQKTSGKIHIIGLDIDPDAIEIAQKNLSGYSGNVTLINANFGRISHILEELSDSRRIESVDLIYADLGISSVQLDDANRGFSFQKDGPLDMRMNPQLPKTAADIINSMKEQELADLIFRYGQEGKSRKIAKLICQARRNRRIDSTAQLADIICQALGISPERLSRQRIHPATKTFQALRIAVNNELGNLEKLLNDAPLLLKPSGRFAVISFHSLEDRMVKENFRMNENSGVYRIITPKPIKPDANEILRNPRARSAKMRVIQKI